MKTLLYFLLFGGFWYQTETSASSCKGSLCFEYGCQFNGIYYSEGETIKDVCFNITCRGEVWQYEGINPNCNICRICDDPHFRTFDKQNYDWHGVCNYSLSQPFCVDINCSYSPNYAVYGDFAECSYNTKVTCLDCTTYKVDPHTSILLQHNQLPYIIEINNNVGSPPSDPTIPYNCDTGDYYPVLTWSEFYSDDLDDGWFHGDCNLILAHNFSVIACPICLFIFTLPTQMNQINGLCGYYDGDSSTEFIKRDDCSLSSVTINPYASSWTTLQQKDDNKCCPQLESLDFSFTADLCEHEIYLSDCKSAVERGFRRCSIVDEKEFELTIQDCVTDCCGDPENTERWIKNAEQVPLLHCEVQRQQNLKPIEA